MGVGERFFALKVGERGMLLSMEFPFRTKVLIIMDKV